MKSTTTNNATTKATNVTVFIGHAAPTTPKANEVVGFAYDMTVTCGDGNSFRHYRNTPVRGKTNNQLDLLAMVFSLRVLKAPASVTFVTDSKYLLGTFAKLREYLKAGWKTRTGSEVANQDGWRCLIDTAKRGGHRFAIVKAEGAAIYQVDICHLEAKKAVNIQLMAELEAKATPAPEAKAAVPPPAKAKPAPGAAQPAPAKEKPERPLTKDEKVLSSFQEEPKERLK